MNIQRQALEEEREDTPKVLCRLLQDLCLPPYIPTLDPTRLLSVVIRYSSAVLHLEHTSEHLATGNFKKTTHFKHAGDSSPGWWGGKLRRSASAAGEFVVADSLLSPTIVALMLVA